MVVRLQVGVKVGVGVRVSEGVEVEVRVQLGVGVWVGLKVQVAVEVGVKVFGSIRNVWRKYITSQVSAEDPSTFTESGGKNRPVTGSLAQEP